MKKATIALVLTMLAFAATTALAQAHFTLRADVPMGFAVEGKQYAAGPYMLRAVHGNRFQLSNIRTGNTSFVLLINHDQVKSGRNSATPVLRFWVNGKRALLTSLTDAAGNTWGIPVAQSDLEAFRNAGSKVEVALK